MAAHSERSDFDLCDHTMTKQLFPVALIPLPYKTLNLKPLLSVRVSMSRNGLCHCSVIAVHIIRSLGKITGGQAIEERQSTNGSEHQDTGQYMTNCKP